MYGCEGAYGAGDAEDDLYSGYNQPEPPRVLGASAGNSLGNSLGSSLGNSLGHSLGGGWRAPLSHAPMRASIASRGTVSRLGLAPPLAESARPLTAVSAAGYSSASRRPPSSGFEAPRMIHSTPRGPAPPLRRRADDSPAEKARESEKQIGALVERAAVLAAGGEHRRSLDERADLLLALARLLGGRVVGASSERRCGPARSRVDHPRRLEARARWAPRRRAVPGGTHGGERAGALGERRGEAESGDGATRGDARAHRCVRERSSPSAS